MASTSTSNQLSQPHPPELDVIAIAKTTRKTLDRLASFSHMRSSSEPNPLLTKILNKILSLIRHVDTSILVVQLAYQLSSDALILCDTEASDWEADVTIDTLREVAGRAQEISKGVMEGFREIKQDVYKIAASTKDDMFLVIVPPDPMHSETMKIHLKDVGTDLVANLSLLSDYSRSMTALAEWCQWVKDDLASEVPSLLPASATLSSATPAVLTGTATGTDRQQTNEALSKYTVWAEMKDSFQEYYNVINVAHLRFPELLGMSSVAWKSIAMARSTEPSTAPQSLHEFADEGVSNSNRQYLRSPTKGILAVVGFFQFQGRRRNRLVGGEQKMEMKEKENGIGRDVGAAADDGGTLRPHTSRDSAETSESSYSNSGGVGSKKEKSRFSCCTAHLFRDGVAFLGNHGCMMR